MKKYFILMLMICMSQFVSAQTAAELINAYKDAPNVQFQSVSGELIKASMPLNAARIPENVDKEILMAAFDSIEKLDVVIMQKPTDLENEKIENQLSDLKKGGYDLYENLAYYKIEDNIVKDVLVSQVESNSGMRVLIHLTCNLTVDQAMQLGGMIKGFMK